MAATPTPPRLQYVIQTATPGATLAVSGEPAAEGGQPRVALALRGPTVEMMVHLDHAQASELRTALQVAILGVGGDYLT